jgi:hypothetical protein
MGWKTTKANTPDSVSRSHGHLAQVGGGGGGCATPIATLVLSTVAGVHDCSPSACRQLSADPCIHERELAHAVTTVGSTATTVYTTSSKI